MLYKCTTLLLLFYLFLPQVAMGGEVTRRIEASQTLVLGTTGDFPPFAANTSQGSIIGLDIDLAQKLANGLRLQLQIKRMEFKKLLPALKDGTIDIAMSGITMLPSRNLEVAFIGPYATSGQSLLGRAAFISTITDNESLTNSSFKVAALKGSTSEKAAREALPQAQLTLTSTHDQSLILLIDKKVDAILADFPFCKVAAFRYSLHGFKTLNNALTFEPLGIAISGDDPLFQNLIQNFLIVMEGSGTLKILKEKWFTNSDWIESLPDMNFFKQLEQ